MTWVINDGKHFPCFILQGGRHGRDLGPAVFFQEISYGPRNIMVVEYRKSLMKILESIRHVVDEVHKNGGKLELKYFIQGSFF